MHVLPPPVLSNAPVLAKLTLLFLHTVAAAHVRRRAGCDADASSHCKTPLLRLRVASPTAACPLHTQQPLKEFLENNASAEVGLQQRFMLIPINATKYVKSVGAWHHFHPSSTLLDPPAASLGQQRATDGGSVRR